VDLAKLCSTIDLRYRSRSAAGCAAAGTAKHTRVVGTADGYLGIIAITLARRIDGDRIDRIPSRKLLSDVGCRCGVRTATPAETDCGRLVTGSPCGDLNFLDGKSCGRGCIDMCHRLSARTASAAEAH